MCHVGSDCLICAILDCLICACDCLICAFDCRICATEVDLLLGLEVGLLLRPQLRRLLLLLLRLLRLHTRVLSSGSTSSAVERTRNIQDSQD